MSRTTPVPAQVGQAPSELNARDSAPGGENTAAHTGQTRSMSAATSMVGPSRWPFGHRCDPRRENITRRTFSSSVDVPNVDLAPGTPGRWRSASAAGMCRTESTAGRAACDMRRRV